MRHHKNIVPAILFGMAILVLPIAGCSLTPNVPQPDAVAGLPDTFAAHDSSSAAADAAWWTSYGDSSLNRVVSVVLENNPDVTAAVARVAELQARYRIARSPQFPAAQIGADGTRQSSPTNTGPTGRFSGNIPGFPDRFDVTTYSASLGLGFELDFWGRARNTARSALHQFLATRADLETVRTAVISEAISAYVDIIETQSLINLTRENIDLLSERTELTQDRFERGLVTSFELYSIRQQYEQARGALPALETRLQSAVGRLAVLAGRFDAEPLVANVDGFSVTGLLAGIPAGVPSDLLLRRPDVAAAGQRLEAARHQIGVARADRFPRFSLTASGGTQSSDLTDLVKTSQRFWLFGGSLTAPLFNAGAINAGIQASWEQYRQQAAAYEKAVLAAFQDVVGALTADTNERERYRIVRDELLYAESSADTQTDRALKGVGDYLAYIDARRNLVRVRSSLVTAEAALVRSRTLVHRALGGAWLDEDVLVSRDAPLRSN